jgi:mRNA interferase HicA
MKRREFLRHLHDQGCVLIREGGNHSWWGNPIKNRRSVVPRHQEIPDILVRKICKDLDIEKP